MENGGLEILLFILYLSQILNFNALVKEAGIGNNVR